MIPRKTLSQQRARSPEDKDLRRTHLIEAATRLFADADFEAVTIERVARMAGVAKGTAYIYFASKEALFLELVRAELTLWLDALTLKLRRLRARQPESAVPMTIARITAQRPLMCRLLVLLHTVIEPNLDGPSAREFKLFMRSLLTQASGAIADRIPGLRVEEAETFMLQTHALVIGITQLSNPRSVIVRVMEQDPKLRSMRIDFEPFLTQALSTLVRGTLGKP